MVGLIYLIFGLKCEEIARMRPLKTMVTGLFVLGLVGMALFAVLPSEGVVYAQTDQDVEECASPSWRGSFYNSVDLSGEPIHVLCRRLIDYQWGEGVPYRGVNIDNFSHRWTSVQAFPAAGTYLFRINVEGGAALYINGEAIINDLSTPNGVRTLQAEYEITNPHSPVAMTFEGAHGTGAAGVNLEWYLIEGGSAGAVQDHAEIMNDDRHPTAFNAGGGNAWKIQHWLNADFAGQPVANGIHVADGISFDYKLRSPKAGLNPDAFSSRWTRTVDFLPGSYTFTVRADDGARIYVDGTQLTNQTPITGGFTTTAELTGGRHTIMVEHWDRAGESSIFVTWDPPVGTMLFPDGCNAVYTAGVNGNAPLCPNRGIAVMQ